MSLFRSAATEIKIPFPIAKYNTIKDKLTFSNEAWNALPLSKQTEATFIPTWDFLEVQGKYYAKYTEEGKEENTILLIPADDYYNTIQKVKFLEENNKLIKEQLRNFIQGVPVPLFVVPNTEKTDPQLVYVTFSNTLLLKALNISLSKFYSGLSIQDIFSHSSQLVLNLCQQAQQKKEQLNELVSIPIVDSNNIKYFIIRLYPFQSEVISGTMIVLLDITKEKEQEQSLKEAYEELNIQAEGLKQYNEELTKAKQIIEQKNKDIEDGLKYASRFHKKLLLNKSRISGVWGEQIISSYAKAYQYVGGDFMDALVHNHHRFLIVGDATGHGTAGSMLALSILSKIKTEILTLTHIDDLPNVLENVRQVIFDLFDVNTQTDTAAEGAEVAILAEKIVQEGNPKEWYYVSAGRPLIICEQNGNILKYEGTKRFIGWNFPGVEVEKFQICKITPPKNSFAFLYTDGFTDQTNPENEKIGNKRVVEWLKEIQNLPLNEKTNYMVKKWEEWKQNEAQVDDILFLFIENHT